MVFEGSWAECSGKVLGFEDHFGLVFLDKGLLLAALDHRGAGSERKKCLAVAGDKLLDFILYDFLIGEGVGYKGLLDTFRQRFSTDCDLALIGREMGLEEFILFPSSATEADIVSGKEFYSATLEALVYVIFKDQGLEGAARFVVEHILSRMPD